MYMYTLHSYYFTHTCTCVQENKVGRMSIETRMRVIGLWKLHFSLKDMQAKLKDEEIRVNKKSLCLLIKKYRC